MSKRLIIEFFSQKKFLFYELLKLIFVPNCILCGSKALDFNLCKLCLLDLPSLPQNCIKCGHFLAFSASLICNKCSNTPPPFDYTLALFPYVQPIETLITALKFKAELACAKFFSLFMIEQIKKWYQHMSLPELIIPVPLHITRLRERGFNQALEIARPISKYYQIRIDTTSVQRVKATKPQSSLSANKREQNIKNAFRASGDYNGKKIAILDDVMTTGHTVMALSQVLKKSKAKEVHIWCCARR